MRPWGCVHVSFHTLPTQHLWPLKISGTASILLSQGLDKKTHLVNFRVPDRLRIMQMNKFRKYLNTILAAFPNLSKLTGPAIWLRGDLPGFSNLVVDALNSAQHCTAHSIAICTFLNNGEPLHSQSICPICTQHISKRFKFLAKTFGHHSCTRFRKAPDVASRVEVVCFRMFQDEPTFCCFKVLSRSFNCSLKYAASSTVPEGYVAKNQPIFRKPLFFLRTLPERRSLRSSTGQG